MQARRGIGSLALALVAAALPAGAADPTHGESTDACRDRAISAVQARYENMRDLSAQFEQTTRAASTGTTPSAPSTSRGHVVLAKPGRMRWTYEEPEPSLVVSDGETLWLYDPNFAEAQKLRASAQQFGGAATQFLLGAGDMRGDFRVSATACSKWSVELELVPREPASYEKLYLIADPDTGDVLRTRVVDLVGNIVTLEFRNARFNTGPEASVFRFEPPEGVEVVEVDP